jgi:hypothetical protein
MSADMVLASAVSCERVQRLRSAGTPGERESGLVAEWPIAYRSPDEGVRRSGQPKLRAVKVPGS